jgi:acyl-CoA dehydrogenase
MLLLNPKHYSRFHPDPQSKALIEKTISFFEQKGLSAIKNDDQNSTWHDDFFQFVREEKIFAQLLTRAGYGSKDSRWDMWRISEFNEILGFYGLSYWYAWQVSILGLGPIWMSDNENAKKEAAAALLDGGIFAFGLSEKAHGADIYSTDMTLTQDGEGRWKAKGTKYYIGNGNKAAMVSTFGKFAATGDYVFFVARPGQAGYTVKKKIATSGVRPAFVAEYELKDYTVTDKDILHRGEQAWNAALNTVNIGKFELGFASIGIATHAFYEAIDHAANRELYKRQVTDFPHVRKLFTEAYARLVAMKLFGLRACDYMRVASPEDRRYLLFNPIMKMKVTGQGEKVVGMLHDIIAAKGFEQDTYFEMAIRDIGMLPKLEGTTHVNMALIIKFIKNYFFGHVSYPDVPQKSEAVDDAYLFRQNSGGLGDIRFGDYRRAFEGEDLSNILLFQKQISLFKKLISETPPTETQQKNVDFMLANGELFTLIAYGQLILENARIYAVKPALKNQIFGFLIRDFSEYALKMILNHSIEPAQEAIYQQMIMKSDTDPAGFHEVWTSDVLPLKDAYRMRN